MGQTPESIETRVRYWQQALGLADYRLVVEVGPIPPGADGEQDAADCEVWPEYFKALQRYDPALIPADEWLATIIHEHVHIPTWGLVFCAETLAGDDPRLQTWVRVEQERMVSLLEKMVLHLITRARTPPCAT